MYFGRAGLRAGRRASERCNCTCRRHLHTARRGGGRPSRCAHKKAREVSRAFRCLNDVDRLDLFYDRIGEAIFDGFVRGHVEVAVGVLLDFFELLAGAFCEDRVELVA